MTADAASPADAWVPLLRIGLAGAAVWHLLGNAGVADGVPAVLVGSAAGLVALLPSNRAVFAAFAVAVWLSIWQEAPYLGNHWLLLGLVAAAVTLASLDRRPGAVVGAAQAVVLVFYAFAAFAKLNADFFDPSTSCATFYAAEGAASLGWDLRRPSGTVGHLLIVAVSLTELAVPVLLVLRRTRVLGVALAMGFHAVLAVDHRHQFFDFTSVLAAVFLTFLPGSVAGDLRRLVTRPVRPILLRVAAAVLAGGAGWLAASDVDPDVPSELGFASWSLVAAVLVPSVLAVAWRLRAAPVERLALPRLATPVVVVALLVGVSPYLELKTGAAWNMYANLRTVAGDSNHFLVRATAPIGRAQDDLVEVVAAEGPLGAYVDSGLLLPRRQLRWYLQTEPDTAATIRIRGRELRFAPGEIPPELGGPVPDVVGRLVALRAVRPPGEPVPCQDTYLPAT